MIARDHSKTTPYTHYLFPQRPAHPEYNDMEQFDVRTVNLVRERASDPVSFTCPVVRLSFHTAIFR